MHPEHEEAMRWDFNDRVAMSWKALWPGVTRADADEIDRRVSEYDQRWQAGPHAHEWAFLHAAYIDWRDRPDQMRHFVADITANPTIYRDHGLTDVQRRSLDQAHNIASEERAAVRALNPPPERRPIHRQR
ncbi:hypothetical protein [Nocardia otitidiscaviarum]|uniref:hypothetical protein n=1 Tax=Nocardia otitidiscaviarum TaxID=1823 RepID=UPI002456E17F|nr:hypothetical protein [Nocardia otitidiscaviarum]